ncbi:MAG: hypothetical protein KY455_08090 [Euryarchaeota archaeon]|nr:hypothetical protein [Euryarchaeota archaeon]
MGRDPADHPYDHDPDAEEDQYDAYVDDDYVEDEDDARSEGDDVMIYGEEEATVGRRRHATLAMTLAAVTFLLSLVVLAAYLGTSSALLDLVDFWSFTTWIWVFSGLLLVFFVWLLVLLFTSPVKEPAPVAEEEEAWPDEDEEEAWGDLPEAETFGLRCTRCRHVFTVTDTGERPLYHTCPSCGARGAYDDRPAASGTTGGPERSGA